MRALRIAFITPGFVTEGNTASGLGNYINKMTQALLAAGHVPEIFVCSFEESGPISHRGVCVHRVYPKLPSGWKRWFQEVPAVQVIGQLRQIGRIRSQMATLAAAFDARDRDAPFDMVQSPDWEGAGSEILPRPGRPHLVRCSVMAELNAVHEQASPPVFPTWQARYELHAVERAEIAYAPSQFAADYYQRRLHRPVQVVRPPALIEIPRDEVPVPGLPEKYFLHFGKLNPSKGTLWLAEALPAAWKEEPELKIVVAGQIHNIDTDALKRRWGARSANVLFLGWLPKPQLYTVLRGALASLVPSIIDNLPNTAIESLLFGIPVIGTRGASIDELVADGVTGELAPVHDVTRLAEAMVRVWTGRSPARRGFKWESPVADQMRPEQAVQNLLTLAGLKA